MNRIGYSYSIIRYTHDAVSGECLNVGVIAYASNGQLEFRIPKSLVRVKHAFPNSSVSALRRLIEVSLQALVQEIKATGNLTESLTHVFASDDAGLKFSRPGAGVTSDLKAAVDELLARFVLRCELEFNLQDLSEVKEPRVIWYTRRVTHPGNDDSYVSSDLRQLRA